MYITNTNYSKINSIYFPYHYNLYFLHNNIKPIILFNLCHPHDIWCVVLTLVHRFSFIWVFLYSPHLSLCMHSLFLTKSIKSSYSSPFYIVEFLQSPAETLHRQRKKTVAPSVLPLWRPSRSGATAILRSPLSYAHCSLGNQCQRK